MATTITPILNSATPYSKQYVVAGDGTQGLRSITQFASDLDEGPLKQALLNMPTTSIANFNADQVYGQAIRIYDVVTSIADAALLRSGTTDIHWVSGANAGVAGLYVNLANLNTRIIEIRLNHGTQA
jgi:hypothetical protein